ncbi:hypothetical protein VE03_00178 [Pseudogymnoascus sp. 23342-1-I1]|nr:hypothetical protein VE03_00178 [Pseudogymnoascus sp. 23342-1-I1]
MASRIFPQFSLTGRTAIVSGAGSGLGLAIAEALAEAGANVAILYHKNSAAVDAAKQVAKEYDVKCIAYQVDVTQPHEVESTVNQVVDEFSGRLDCFIANSGIAYGKKLEDFQKGSFVATASMSGHIVNYPHIQTAYNASKAGVIHMCKSLAVEWVDFARANTVSPGFIESGLTGAVSEDVKDTLREKTPVKRIGDLHEMKGAYLYLASDASSFATGTDIVADGGYRLW